MYRTLTSKSPRTSQSGLTGLAVGILILAVSSQAMAVPTFSRKYGTSCITCHSVFPKLTDVGESFRRNGYQFARDDDILVRDEPVSMGNEAYEDMFPNSVWPSDMPHLPPLFIRAQLRETIHTDPQGLTWDQDFPHEVALGGVGTFGEDISAWWEMEAEPISEAIGVERAFVQFSNLFAWDEEEDENGTHRANHWLALPRHALNLRVGRMEPQVLPHVFSQHARITIEQPLVARQRYGSNRFRFEPAQTAAVELHGILKQYTSYVVGFANGGNNNLASFDSQWDENNQKDVYFRVSHKWCGFPLDGVLGTADQVKETTPEMSAGEDKDLFAPAGLDWYRALGFETGLFGWYGTSELSDLGVQRNDYFTRYGADARLQWFDWDIYALGYLGHDSFAGRVNNVDLGGEDWAAFTVQADYMVKPWLLVFNRWEQSAFREGARQNKEQERLVTGVDAVIRQNMKLQVEYIADASGHDHGGREKTDPIRIQLDYAY